MRKAKKHLNPRSSNSIRLTAAILIILGLAAAFPAMGLSGTTPGSDVRIFCNGNDVFWASYSDYQQGLLTVKYDVRNIGSGAAYNTTVMTATAGSGVTAGSAVPIWLGDMNPGGTGYAVMKWHVPQGVPAFRTTLDLCSDCSPNICVDGTNGGVDIKPGSCPNPINIGQGNAQVAVAVFSYGTFDATTLDDNTVVFAGASPANVAQEDKNGDGRLDMLYHFSRSALVLQVGDSRACLSAAIDGGGTFRSCDMVIVQ